VKIFLAQAMGLLKSTHPIPSFAVTTFSLMFGVGLSLPIGQVVLVGLSVLAQQFSVGLSNDWLDYARDKSVNRSDKPTTPDQYGCGKCEHRQVFARAATVAEARFCDSCNP
jgi:4-hydroxybenzoate polyprenyltransferase